MKYKVNMKKYKENRMLNMNMENAY